MSFRRFPSAPLLSNARFVLDFGSYTTTRPFQQVQVSTSNQVIVPIVNSMGSSFSLSSFGGGGDNNTLSDRSIIPEPVQQQTGTSVVGQQSEADQLRQALMPTFEKLYQHEPESISFRQPVDPDILSIPDYFDIVKKPMDLSTIKKKLESGEYSDPLEYCDDVWLMFDNARLYNNETSRVYKHSIKLSEVFAGLIRPVLKSLGYHHERIDQS